MRLIWNPEIGDHGHAIRECPDMSNLIELPPEVALSPRERRKLSTRELHMRWHTEFLRLKEQNPKKQGLDTWISVQISKHPDLAQGRSRETIRRRMKHPP
jgi:thymidylate kinase